MIRSAGMVSVLDCRFKRLESLEAKMPGVRTGTESARRRYGADAGHHPVNWPDAEVSSASPNATIPLYYCASRYNAPFV